MDEIRAAGQQVSDAIGTGREPGMPLDILARRVREAPLAGRPQASRCLNRLDW
jgi:hypothetical protein